MCLLVYNITVEDCLEQEKLCTGRVAKVLCSAQLIVGMFLSKLGLSTNE